MAAPEGQAGEKPGLAETLDQWPGVEDGVARAAHADQAEAEPHCGNDPKRNGRSRIPIGRVPFHCGLCQPLGRAGGTAVRLAEA